MKFSVIIPCWNVEMYVTQALDSVFAQTETDLEVICVDDGSTDQTADILDRYAAKESRLRVIHQENQGLSVARNVAFQAAQGKYIYYLDGDDYLHDQAFFSRSFRQMEEHQLDILVGSATIFFDPPAFEAEHHRAKDMLTIKADYPDTVYRGDEAITALHGNKDWQPSVSEKLFRRQFLLDHQLFFTPGQIYEDEAFTFNSMLLADRVGIVKDSFFSRRLRPNSITTSKLTHLHTRGMLTNMMHTMQLLDQNKDRHRFQPHLVSMVTRYKVGTANSYLRLDEEERNLFMQCLSPEERYYFVVLVRGEVELRRKLDLSESHTAEVLASRSFRLGAALTWPLRKLRTIVFRARQRSANL